MVFIVDLLFGAAVLGMIGVMVAYRLTNKKYAWVGGLIGVILAIFVIYPEVVLLPITFLGQLEYCYNNLDYTDIWDPVNAVFILYVTMFLYLLAVLLVVFKKTYTMRLKVNA